MILYLRLRTNGTMVPWYSTTMVRVRTRVQIQHYLKNDLYHGTYVVRMYVLVFQVVFEIGLLYFK